MKIRFPSGSAGLGIIFGIPIILLCIGAWVLFIWAMSHLVST